MPKHTTDQPDATQKTDLSRAVKMEKAAAPKRATLDLQRRPRLSDSQGRKKAYLRIDRGHKA